MMTLRVVVEISENKSEEDQAVLHHARSYFKNTTQWYV